jgi:hypothetical protein
MRTKRRSLLFAAAIWLMTGGVALADDAQIYSTLHPYYAELCALSGFKKKPGVLADQGGPGGHAVFYLNGVCRVEDTRYPVIELCRPGSGSGRDGAGLSVNANFKNANWVATEGRDFFFRGGLAPGQRLTKAAYLKTLKQAEEMGIYDGVQFHDDAFDDKPANMSQHDFIYEESVGTDFAVAFGRNRYCARVPLARDQMTAVVRYLNDVNSTYRDGTKEYDLGVLENNCAHLVHNALAAAGIWDEWPVDRFILVAALDFPVPANEFVNLMRRTNDLPLDNLDELYADESARALLLQQGRLPTRPGALAEWDSVIHDNDIYETDAATLIFFDDPIFEAYKTRATAILTEPRYFDVRANLEYFAALYRRVQETRRPLASYERGGDRMTLNTPENPSPPERPDFPQFYARYYKYIEQQSARIDAQLAALPPAQ